VPENQGVIYVTVDGQVSCELLQGDRVEIERSQNTVKFVRSPSRSYFKILQGKLNWGIPNSAD
jgi:NAD kinase